MKTKATVYLLLAMLLCPALGAARMPAPKREFRGAWLHTVYQEQYRRQSTEQNKAYLRRQLDSLHACGVNAVLFQVRPQADAFYASRLEPWSRFLTDNGAAPRPMWDPLQFMVEEAHARGMELHAWLNPYRVTSSARQTLPPGHIYHSHPERFVRYDGKLYFDPGLPENREFIGQVVMDIVGRYDVDGIHFDDYFYPYPVKGKVFPDDKSYSRYGRGLNRGDWRRSNVDSLICAVHRAISSGPRPWVRFGVSPFGIWRNASSDPRGSATRGLQNYDDLYADVLLWARRGWVDYLLPQLYWEMEHKAAPYGELVQWWARNAGDCHLYVGQDVARSMDAPDGDPAYGSCQLCRKVQLTRELDAVQGNCWWPGYEIARNRGGVADSLACSLQATVALVPAYHRIASRGPAAVSGLRLDGGRLRWHAPMTEGVTEDAVRFVVYRFDNRRTDIADASAIVAVTPQLEIEVTRPGYYVVTALDRANNESEPSRPLRKK